MSQYIRTEIGNLCLSKIILGEYAVVIFNPCLTGTLLLIPKCKQQLSSVVGITPLRLECILLCVIVY